MTESSSHPDLSPLRQRIDQLDEQIIRLLNDRANVVLDIGKAKQGQQQATYAPDRERHVLEHIRAVNQGPTPDKAMEAIYREIMSAAFALQRAPRVAYLGPAGSFSHQAAIAQFGSSSDYIAVDFISQVFQEVERGAVDMGLVPIENSTGGGIRLTLDCFMQSTAKVCAEVLLYVHQNVMSKGGDEQITKVCSHPEVFDQCRRWLGTHLQQAERVPLNSTAKAAELAVTDPTVAAIGSSLAAKMYDLPIKHANIEDNPNNVTRFFVIGRDTAKPSGGGADKTAIMFTTAHKPGTLAEVINVFARHGVNLTHIDKRPSQRVNWEYYFFIDCEGHTDDPNMVHALEEARTHCLHLSVLGSFPKASQVLG